MKKNAPTKKPAKRRNRPKPVEEILFTRDTGKKVPVKVQDAADLWLDLFTNIAGMTALDPENPTPGMTREMWLDEAAILADHALSLYESRWPHMAHGELKC